MAAFWAGMLFQWHHNSKSELELRFQLSKAHIFEAQEQDTLHRHVFDGPVILNRDDPGDNLSCNLLTMLKI